MNQKNAIAMMKLFISECAIFSWIQFNSVEFNHRMERIKFKNKKEFMLS